MRYRTYGGVRGRSREAPPTRFFSSYLIPNFVSNPLAQSALELYDVYQEKIKACDEEIEKCLCQFESRVEVRKEEKHRKIKGSSKNAPSFDLHAHLVRITGVDLTKVPGIDASSALKIISEIGLDLSRWEDAKQFASWLGICPGNKVSGGKKLSGKSKRSKNRVASTLRMAASTLYRNKSALGAFLRRLKSRLGPGKAIAATAHKLAIILFNMLKKGLEYIETGQDYYEKQYRERLVKSLSLRAKDLGFELVETSTNSLSYEGVI